MIDIPDHALRWTTKVRHLRRAALRAAREGDHRVAETLRKIAEEARPADSVFAAGGPLATPTFNQ